MIPLHLHLSNFMSYGEGATMLDFTGWRIACLSGSNGHGKSALFDAMTWALWGRCRAKREDDVVRQGATHAEVEFEFVVGDGTYRVVRKRTLRRTASQTTLELHVLHDGTWKTATGASVAETQATLAGILRLSYDTFINSAFLMQGHADEFTVKAPGERKKVLGEILGLGRYDQLTERARVLARDREGEISRVRERLEELGRGIAEEFALLEQERALERESLQVATTLAQKRLDLDRLRDRQKERDRLARELLSTRESQTKLAADIARDRDGCAKLEQFIVRCDALIGDQEAIEQSYLALQQARIALDAANQAALRIAALERRLHELEKAISAAETKIRELAQAERVRAAQHEGLANQAPRLAEEIGTLTIQVAGLALADKALQELQAHRQASRTEIATLESESDALGKQRTVLRDRLKMLKGADALCPVCRSPLGPAQRQEVEAAYVAEGTALKGRQETNEARIRLLQDEISRLSRDEPAQMADVQARQKAAGTLQSRQAQLQQAREAEARAGEARQRAAQIEAHLGTPQVAPAEHTELARLRDELALIDYDEQGHAALRHRVDELAEVQERRDKLHKALAERQPRQEQLHDLRGRVVRAEKELCALATQAGHLEGQLGELDELPTQLSAAAEAITALEGQGHEIRHRLGIIGGALQRIAAQRIEHDALVARAADLEKDYGAYTDLGHAFGRQGIQAMLIDAVLPEIETVANEILSRMTDNSVQVQFSTQRTGSAGNVIETLDIRIADSAGTRSYEMFSGGEAFRVNFAIRVALSRLLAGRAGASLQTLIIDEGFGSQDGAGRERLVEAINSVAEDFQKIVVITHIAELKDYFPVQIDVVKGIGGSQVFLAE